MLIIKPARLRRIVEPHRHINPTSKAAKSQNFRALIPKLLDSDLLIGFDRPAVVRLQRMDLVGWELDSGSAVSEDLIALIERAESLLDALDELRFMHNLTTLINGSLLCPEVMSIDLFLEYAIERRRTSRALQGPPLASR